MNFHLKKPWKSGSHKDPNNRMLTDRGSKYGILFDADADGREKLERKTSAGTVVFHDGMAVVPDDMRGKDIAAELKAKSRYPEQINYHPGREGMMLKRDHQIVWRVPAWNTKCNVDGCQNESVIQRQCEQHWGARWTGA